MLYEKVGHRPLTLIITRLRICCGLGVLLPALLVLLSLSQARSQGLLFNSNDSLLLKRTAYQVFKSNIPQFTNGFSISFDLSVWDKKHFGHVLTIKEDAGKLYTLSYLYPGKDTGYLHLNIGNQSNKIKIQLTPNLLQQRQWISIRLDFHLQTDSIYMQVNNKLYKAGGFGLSSSMHPGLFFGKFEAFNDVPSMAIRNLHISGNGIDYYFPLNEWRGETVHSASGKPTGHVDFPNWLINESFFWKERSTKKFDEVTGTCFIPDSSQLLIYGKQSMQVYDISKDQLREVRYRNELPVNMILGKSIYIPSENKLYVYEANDVRKDDPTIAALDLKTLEWSVIGTAYVPEQRHHHNILFDSLSQQFYLFGGYGSFSYFNTVFRYAKGTDQWERIAFKGDTITPRFFSASGNAGKPDEVFLFGGFGNASGQQVIGGKHTYDLYRINLSAHTTRKLWEKKISDSNFVPANNLILSNDQQYFYVICYPHHISRTGLQLYRFSVNDGSYEIVSSKIPVISEKIESDINLYLNKTTGELYCIIQEFANAKSSIVKIYSLAFPPVVPAPENTGSSSKTLWSVFVAGFLLIAGILLWWRKSQKGHKSQQSSASGKETGQTAPGLQHETESAAGIQKNAIYILGPLTVFDKKGTDITHLFSPKIRLLFVLILLKTRKGGITSREISLALWPDKEVSKTKNIRGVNINHLRNALADMEGIRLVFVNDSYIFEMDDRVFCDYLSLLKEVRSDSGIDITPLFSRGNLLSDLDDPTLDSLRQGYEDEILPFIFEKMQISYQQQEHKTVFRLSESVLETDPFNETAIQYQIAVLRRWKGAEAARKKYEAFAANYERSLGIAYSIPFDKVPLPEPGQPPQ